MCLEWTRRDDDVITENEWSTSEYMSKTLIYGGAIISAGPAALIASMQTKLREVLTIGTLFTLCGSIVLMTCSTGALSTLIIGRILHGMGAGVVCVVVPNYAAEITEPKYRDVLTGLHQIYLLSGIMLSHFVDDYCMYSYVNIGIVVMAILNLIVLCVIEDPPCFQLIFYENLRKSESDCKCIDVSSNSCHKLLRYRDIDKIMELSSIFTKKQYYRPLFINICLISIQQFSGNISLMEKLQCAYGKQLPLSGTISTIIVFQVSRGEGLLPNVKHIIVFPYWLVETFRHFIYCSIAGWRLCRSSTTLTNSTADYRVSGPFKDILILIRSSYKKFYGVSIGAPLALLCVIRTLISIAAWLSVD
ncbi:hypothetical protein QTP88_027636 [Uroleucon formosanum]